MARSAANSGLVVFLYLPEKGCVEYHSYFVGMLAISQGQPGEVGGLLHW